jgi:hypothetical protein
MEDGRAVVLHSIGDARRVRFALSSKKDAWLDARPKSESARIFARFRRIYSQVAEKAVLNQA